MTAARFQPGWYTTNAPASSVAGDWRMAGWTARVVTLDDLGKDPARTVVEAVATALRLKDGPTTPDALATSLRGLTQPSVLVWTRGAAFVDAHPALWAKLADVLTARTKQQPGFAVVLAGGDARGL